MPSAGVQTCALRSEEHTPELQSHDNLVCRLLLETTRTRTHVPAPPPPSPPLGLLPAVARGARSSPRSRRCPRSWAPSSFWPPARSFFCQTARPASSSPFPPPPALPR